MFFDRLKRVKSVAQSLRREEGLTLIEVLAVVVILGIIAAIAIPVVTNAIDESKVNSTEATLGTLQTALERYYFDEGSYPTNLTALSSNPFNNITSGSSNYSPADYANWQGPYLRGNPPINDAWNNSIYYEPIPVGASTIVTALTSISGYIVVSGDGTSIALTTGTTPNVLSTSETQQLIYAAGGNDNGSSFTAGSTSVSIPAGSISIGPTTTKAVPVQQATSTPSTTSQALSSELYNDMTDAGTATLKYAFTNG